MLGDPLWDGQEGRGGLTWARRSAMGPLRGVLDAADDSGRRNNYMHRVHTYALQRLLASQRQEFTTALDFGCGTGRFLPLLSCYSRDVYAVDRSPEMASAARAYNPELAGSILCCDDALLPFDAARFDLVLCFCVISVTAKELCELAFDEIARVCKPSGTLVLCEKIFDAEPYTVDGYRAALSRHGFTVRKSFPIRSGTSKFTKVGSLDWLTPRLSRWVAAAEVRLTSARRYTSTAGSYVEHAFLCERA